MAAFNDGLFTSKLHTFLVGEDKKAIIVHAEAIATQSHGLDVLINGKMAEASNMQTELDDVLEETFIRCCQFAYTGDYQTPAFVQECKPEDPNASTSSTPLAAGEVAVLVVEAEEETAPSWSFDAPEVDVANDDWNGWGVKPKKSKKPLSISRTLRQEFDHKAYNITIAQSVAKARCKIRGNELPEEDYTPVFLGHARLYVFAEKWGIEALKTLTLHKLHKTLAAFKVYKGRRGDIVELVRFAYSNENTPDLEDNLDQLRALVVHYVTCELESLIEVPEFLALLEQSGLFSRDLVKMMMGLIV